MLLNNSPIKNLPDGIGTQHTPETPALKCGLTLICLICCHGSPLVFSRCTLKASSTNIVVLSDTVHILLGLYLGCLKQYLVGKGSTEKNIHNNNNSLILHVMSKKLIHNQSVIKITSAQMGVFYSFYMNDKTRLQNKELRKIRVKTIALLKWSRSQFFSYYSVKWQ